MNAPTASDALRTALRGYEPSPEQWAAITAPLEPQCVIAGAGSGKTAVMTARIVWLVEQGLVRPSGVCGLTFTNKAAAELEDRVTQALAAMDPHPRENPTVLTYHAFAAQVVRENGARLGIQADAALLSEAQKWQMLLGLVESLPPLDELQLRHPLSFIPQTLALAGQCADHLKTPQEVIEDCDRTLPRLADDRSRVAAMKRRDLCHIVDAYQRAKHRAGRIDFGDQIRLAVELLQRFDDVRGGYRERFPVVLLDEYQDTNPAQKTLMALICPPGSAVTAVGDARQAIYAWRGATMFNLLEFPRDFARADGTPASETSLAANYRSGRRIVEVANRVIAHVPAQRRRGAELRAVEANGEAWVGAGMFADQDAEAAYVVDEIEREHTAGTPWREMAVLLRKKRYMDRIAALLEARDVPYEIPELGGLLKVPPVIDAIAWLRVLNDPGPSTNRWVARILLGPAWRVHYRDLAPIAKWAAARNVELRQEASELLGVWEPDPGEVAFSLLEALHHTDEVEGVSDEARQRIGGFCSLVVELRAQTSRPLMELAQVVIDRTGIADTLAASPSRSAQAMARNLQTFVGVCGGFSPLDGEATLSSFLDYLDAAEESEDTIPLATTAPSDSVKILTVHAAKGLEFDVVFVPVLAAEQKENKDGWRMGSVFPDVRASDPATSAQSLPNTIRDDAAWQPKPEDFNTKAAYARELKERALEDERRLFYVAVTRARRRLHATAAWWYEPNATTESTRKPKGPSIFFDELAALRAESLVELVRDDACPDENPVLQRLSAQIRWPPRAAAPEELLEWLRLVDDLRARPEGIEDLLQEAGPSARTLYEDHVRTVQALAEPPAAGADAEAAAPGRARSLPATAVARILAGKHQAADALSPLPQPPTPAQRLGIQVHAWIEERARGLVGLADEEALDEASAPAQPADVERLKANYAAMGFESRELARLDTGEPMTELAFTLKTGSSPADGLLVRGRIDAVFMGEGGGLEIVDFKTGRVPDEPDWSQLRLYAEALAELGLCRGAVTLTYVYLQAAEGRSSAYEPQGLAWVEGALRPTLALPAPASTGTPR